MAEDAAAEQEHLLLQTLADERPPLPPKLPMLDPNVAVASPELSRQLRHLDSFLAAIGFLNSGDSAAQIVRSCFVFVLLGVAAPVVGIYIARCPDGEEGKDCRWFHVQRFDISFFCFDFLLAASSLACISMKLFKYGTRSLLFVDPQQAKDERFQTEYARKIQVSSIVQVGGVVLCLHAAAKISHRDQSVGAIASRWHAQATCAPSDESQLRVNRELGDSFNHNGEGFFRK